MMWNGRRYTAWIGVVALVWFSAVVVWMPITQAQYDSNQATTTLDISICGDGLLNPGEVCDDGAANNDGGYATSTATRHCIATCNGFGPYCGDDILQTFFGEECDDGNNTAGDLCDALCQNETPPTTVEGGTGGSSGGGGGGSSGGDNPEGTDDGEFDIDADTEVEIRGVAYPNATVNILVDGEIEEVVEADSRGVFEKDFLNVLTPGATTLGFWALDGADRRSITFSTTFEVVQSAVTTVSGIFIPPTIEVNPTQLSLGQTLSVRGEAPPNQTLITTIDNGDVTATTSSATTGEWLVSIPTGTLANESFHGAKARYEDPDNSSDESGFSQIVNFYIGVRDVGDIISPDINVDGRVDLIDFSILLFNWGTSATIADFNQDGTVDLADFSIMLFEWTG